MSKGGRRQKQQEPQAPTLFEQGALEPDSGGQIRPTSTEAEKVSDSPKPDPKTNQKPEVIPEKRKTPNKPAKKKVGEKRYYAWTQLYEARMARLPERPIVVGGAPRGRPSRAVPVKQTSMRLTDSDKEALMEWQNLLTVPLGRKPSLGETAGIVSRILSERLRSIKELDTGSGKFSSLSDLVEFILGEV